MSRWIAGFLIAIAVGSGHTAEPLPGSRMTTDRQIIDTLARVHDQGADLFNAGDHYGCYRLFQGALATIQIVLPRELQERVQRGLAQAELSGDNIRRAMALHELIEEVRTKLHPTASMGEALPKPRTAPTEPPVGPAPLPMNPKTEPIQPPKPTPTTGAPFSPPPALEFSTPEPPKAPALPQRNGRTPPPPVTSSLPTSQPKPRVSNDTETKEAPSVPPRPREPVPPWEDHPTKSTVPPPGPSPRSGVPVPPFELEPVPGTKPQQPAPSVPTKRADLEPPPPVKSLERTKDEPKRISPSTEPPLPELFPPGVPRQGPAVPKNAPELQPPPPVKPNEPATAPQTAPELQPPPPVKLNEVEKLPPPRVVPEFSVPPLEMPRSQPKGSDIPPLVVPGK